MSEVVIIGGGPSLYGFDFNRLKSHTCIVANHAINDIPWATYFVTTDQTYLRKTKVKLPKTTTKVFVTNMATGFLVEKDGQVIDRRMNLIYDFSQFDVVIKSTKSEGIGKTFNDFRNGANSGFCAFQLALLLGFKTIKLLGIDLNINSKTHYHSAYSGMKPGSLDRFYEHFESGIKLSRIKYPDVQILSCSPISRLNSILAYQEF